MLAVKLMKVEMVNIAEICVNSLKYIHTISYRKVLKNSHHQWHLVVWPLKLECLQDSSVQYPVMSFCGEGKEIQLLHFRSLCDTIMWIFKGHCLANPFPQYGHKHFTPKCSIQIQINTDQYRSALELFFTLNKWLLHFIHDLFSCGYLNDLALKILHYNVCK